MTKHIIVFDSGLGGLTILEALFQLLPGYRYSYAMDNEAFPYGDKTEDFLVERSHSLFSSLIEEAQPDLVVIACNTASTLLLDHLRDSFDVPFVGVVPAIKPAAEISKTRHICLLATPATIERNYITMLHEQFGKDCKVLRHGNQALVTLAEEKIRTGMVSIDTIKEALSDLFNQADIEKVDTIILGCTHFPAIRDEIRQAWPGNVEIIDTGNAIARRVASLLGKPEANNDPAPGNLYFTGTNEEIVASRLLEPFKITSFTKINLK